MLYRRMLVNVIMRVTLLVSGCLQEYIDFLNLDYLCIKLIVFQCKFFIIMDYIYILLQDYVGFFLCPFNFLNNVIKKVYRLSFNEYVLPMNLIQALRK